MTAARDLLDIAADYVEARKASELADAYGAESAVSLDDIAQRWEGALEGYLVERQR